MNRSNCLNPRKPLKGTGQAVQTVQDFLANCLLPFNKSTMGLATNIEEYVPTTIPSIMAKAKLCITSPPNTKRASAGKKVVREVTIDLERTSLILLFIT